MRMKNFIAQSILSIQQPEMRDTLPVKLSEPKFSSVEWNKDLIQSFSAAYLQVVNTRSSIHVISIFISLGITQFLQLQAEILVLSLRGWDFSTMWNHLSFCMVPMIVMTMIRTFGENCLLKIHVPTRSEILVRLREKYKAMTNYFNLKKPTMPSRNSDSLKLRSKARQLLYPWSALMHYWQMQLTRF